MASLLQSSSASTTCSAWSTDESAIFSAGFDGNNIMVWQVLNNGCSPLRALCCLMPRVAHTHTHTHLHLASRMLSVKPGQFSSLLSCDTSTYITYTSHLHMDIHVTPRHTCHPCHTSTYMHRRQGKPSFAQTDKCDASGSWRFYTCIASCDFTAWCAHAVFQCI